MRVIAGLILWCGLCLIVGAAGSIATARSLADWYPGLAKPSWTPPNWIFAPAWTLLYVLMGIAAWKIWKQGGFSQARGPLALFFLQLSFNAAWSWLFFGLKSPMAGLIDIALLWISIAATIVSFGRMSPAAAWLMAPYLAWVSYASALNLAIVWMNRAA